MMPTIVGKTVLYSFKKNEWVSPREGIFNGERQLEVEEEF